MDIQGSIDRITFANATNGYTVARVLTDEPLGQIVTVTGVFPEIFPGAFFQFSGKWVDHKVYGKQFHAERILPIRPQTVEAITKYLGSGFIAGIGPAFAEKITRHFGDDTFTILDKDPKRLKEVKGLGQKKIKAIIEAWHADATQTQAQLFCVSLDMSQNLSTKVILTYGPDTVRKVSENPYSLARDIKGVGFQTADHIAHRLGIEPSSPHRIAAAICYLLDEAQNEGHCFLDSDQLESGLGKLLKLDTLALKPRLESLIERLNREDLLVTESQVGHFSPSIYWAENRTARGLINLLKLAPKIDPVQLRSWLEQTHSIRGLDALSTAQISAVQKAVSHKVFILTGGPGVGKTTTANAIIDLFKILGLRVLLAAPTGRAAQRLTQVSQVQALTIHRLLEWSPDGFKRNKDRTLEADVLIIDEASMLDIRLMSAVVDALPPSCQLILIGDADQLPAVGPGSVLRDLLDSPLIPQVRLKEIFRQAKTSKIIMGSHAIQQGLLPEFSGEPSGDCFFIETQSNEELIHQLLDWSLTKLPARGLDPLRDCQILTPMNQGMVGTQELNKLLQSHLNPEPVPRGPAFITRWQEFREKDKVIQCANNYEKAVFNGDIGQVIQAQSNLLRVNFSGRLVSFDLEEAESLKLAYAVTIHKAQGSEFPCVLIPLTTSHYVMLQRNLIYTALTRAKQCAVLIGSKRALAMAVANQASKTRQTRLKARLEEYQNGFI